MEKRTKTRRSGKKNRDTEKRRLVYFTDSYLIFFLYEDAGCCFLSLFKTIPKNKIKDKFSFFKFFILRKNIDDKASYFVEISFSMFF